MKITNLAVSNFRAIREVEMTDLGDMIMIGGPNGCGKSCILDSIRLLKSVYGGYSPNEWQQWFGEFQIDFQRNPRQMMNLLRDRSKSAVVELTIELHPNEIEHIRFKARSLAEDLVWKSVVPGLNDPWLRGRSALAAELRAYKPEVDRKTDEALPALLSQLAEATHQGRLEITPLGEARTTNNVLLEILFSAYEPKKIGLLDYHGSHRNYGREQLGGINLNLETEEDRSRQHVLYNYGQKYANIKSEMAAEFVRQALTDKAVGVSYSRKAQSLSETLQELFAIFFPGKRFEGPVPTPEGNLDFPVTIEGGGRHDINDLSSGEKEVLFGYLRLRNSAARYSIILLDEPELHLNPALVRGLPQFYHKHLGINLDNQIWLVTHSDAFLRESVGNPGIGVYHMQYSRSNTEAGNQIRQIRADEEVETAIIELVGDLAAYRPGAKVVFFEGEDSEFDLKTVARLFPDAEKTMNFVSGGNRTRVERLHRTLEASVKAGSIPVKIYSIVDKDSGPEEGGTVFKRHFTWDVYHIENYLLEPTYILESLKQVGIYPLDLSDEAAVENELLNIAREQISELISHLLRDEARKILIDEIRLNPNVEAKDLGEEMHRVVIRSVEQLQRRVGIGLDVNTLREKAAAHRSLLEESLDNAEWKRHFRGRNVLRSFVGKHVPGLRYEHFRSLIVSTMANAGFQPPGMKRVIEAVLQDK
jgi:hypothetical protein